MGHHSRVKCKMSRVKFYVTFHHACIILYREYIFMRDRWRINMGAKQRKKNAHKGSSHACARYRERENAAWAIPLHPVAQVEIIRLGECSGIPATNRIGNIVPRIFKPSRLPPQIRAGITRGNKRGGGNRKIRIKEISHNISFIRLYA